MTIQQLRATKGEFKSASVLYDGIQADPDFKHSIETLYFDVFGRKLNKGCSSCWFDAYVELVYQPIEKLMKQIECRFALRAGALLVDVATGDNKKMATNNNLTDELALYHLRTNPSCRKFFTKPEPKELETIIASFDKDKAVEAKAKLEAKLSKLRTALVGATQKLDTAKLSEDKAAIAKAQTAVDKIGQQEQNVRKSLEGFNE